MSHFEQNFETRIFLWLLLLVSLTFVWVLKPFFGPIFWACALAIIFYPVKSGLFARFDHRPSLQALLTLLLCLVIVIIPVVFLIGSVTSEAITLYQKVESGEIDPGRHLEKAQTTLPVVQSFLDKVGIDLTELKAKAGDLAVNSGKFIAQHTLSIGQNAFKFVLDFCLMLYLLFFLLREGKSLVDLMVRALPMGDERERLLFAKFAEVTRATVKGNMVVAIVQGGLGGLIFWILGIPAALLWAVVMAFCSLIPAVGAAIIWAPVAIYLLATGHLVQGVVLIAFGGGIIGLVDNILRPILVGRDTKLPDYVVLLSTLGGLALFGINGFVIGPLVAALFFAFWGIFMREIHTEEAFEHILDEEEKETDEEKAVSNDPDSTVDSERNSGNE